jgi:hypothetical protein
MRSISQKILVDRLDHALSSRGVDLKRSVVIEMVAQAFGLGNSDQLAAIAKTGDLDPPEAVEVSSEETRGLVHLMDPNTSSVFSYDPEALSAEKRDRFVVSPYGSLLAVPQKARRGSIIDAMPPLLDEYVQSAMRGGTVHVADLVSKGAHGWEVRPASDGSAPNPVGVGMDEDNLQYKQIGQAREIASQDEGQGGDGVCGLEKYGLERFRGLTYLDTEQNPMSTMTCEGVSLVDGRVHLTFVGYHEYDGHHDAVMSIDEVERVAMKAAPGILATRSVLRWTDDTRRGLMTMHLHVPESAFSHLDDEEQLEDALRSLMGSSAAFGDHHLKTVMDDDAPNAIDHEGTAFHQSGPPTDVRYWKDECRATRKIVHEHEFENGIRLPDTRDIREARALTCASMRILSDDAHFEQELVLAPLAVVDGKVHHVVSLRHPCAPHEDGARDTLARLLERVQDRVAPLLERIGGWWILEDEGDLMSLTAYIPITVSEDVHDLGSWKEAIAHLFGDRRNGSVHAKYVPQAWVKDQAVDVDPDGPTSIDITWEILTMDREEALTFHDDREFTEGLIDAVMAPDWIRNRQGPSSIEARVAVDRFFEARTRRLLEEDESRGDDPTSHWAAANLTERHEFGEFPLERSHQDERVMRMVPLLITRIAISDDDAVVEADTITMVDGVPHIRISYQLACGTRDGSREQAAVAIDLMHAKIEERVRGVGGVQRRHNLKTAVRLVVYIPYDAVKDVEGPSIWKQTVQTLFGG